MTETVKTSEQKKHKHGAVMFLIMLAIIVVAIASFVILRPVPGGTSSRTVTTPASANPAK